jgi:hypothetical protein
MNRRVWLPALLALPAVAAFGQEGFRGPAVTGAAYSAEQVSENVQTLADGTHITHKSTVKMYRDSEGRTRTERFMAPHGADAGDGPEMIEISDPVAHVHYTLSAADKTAHKRAFAPPESGRALNAVTTGNSQLPILIRDFGAPPPPAPSGPARGAADAEGPKITSEKLGSDTMQGLLVEGTRHTTIWPAGSSMGNDRPITAVSETWLSPDLKIVVMSKHMDPRTGEHTQRLVNVSRAEPDASLFQPPADYAVTEENGEVLRH